MAKREQNELEMEVGSRLSDKLNSSPDQDVDKSDTSSTRRGGNYHRNATRASSRHANTQASRCD